MNVYIKDLDKFLAYIKCSANNKYYSCTFIVSGKGSILILCLYEQLVLFTFVSPVPKLMSDLDIHL